MAAQLASALHHYALMMNSIVMIWNTIAPLCDSLYARQQPVNTAAQVNAIHHTTTHHTTQHTPHRTQHSIYHTTHHTTTHHILYTTHHTLYTTRHSNALNSSLTFDADNVQCASRQPCIADAIPQQRQPHHTSPHQREGTAINTTNASAFGIDDVIKGHTRAGRKTEHWKSQGKFAACCLGITVGECGHFQRL